MYDINSEEELNGEFGTAYHNNDSGNDNEDHIPRSKVPPVKNKK